MNLWNTTKFYYIIFINCYKKVLLNKLKDVVNGQDHFEGGEETPIYEVRYLAYNPTDRIMWLDQV